MRFLLCSMVLLVGSMTEVNAQWFNKTDDDPFGGDKTSIAMTAVGEYAFGYFCKGKDEQRLIYLTVENADKGVETLNLLSPKLKIRVDEADVVEFDASFDAAGDKIRVTVDGPKVLPLVEAMAAAKRRVAVAVELGGKRFHTNAFGVAGSRAALERSVKACGLSLGATGKI